MFIVAQTVIPRGHGDSTGQEGKETMRRWILCVVLLLALPVVACSFSVNLGGDETPEPSGPVSTATPAEAAFTPAPTQELPTPALPTPTTPAIAGPNVYDVFFAIDVTDDGEPVDIAADFPVGTTVVYAFASFDGMSDGVECESVWYQDGEEVLRDPFTWELGESASPLWIANVKNEDGLAPAKYSWELYVDGDFMVTASFIIGQEGLSPTLYEDDFSDPDSGWADTELDGGRVGYLDGFYYVSSLTEGTLIWVSAGASLSDVAINVEATQAYAGPDSDNAYGVMCRVQSNDDGYLLRISGDGYYSIHKRLGEEYVALVDWTTSDVIRQGNSRNDIQAVCDGPRLVLIVNGQLLGEANDSTFAEGDIGLVVTTYEEAATEVNFDNLVVTRPGASP